MNNQLFSFYFILAFVLLSFTTQAQLHQWSFALGKQQLTRPMDIETDVQGNVIVASILSDSLDLDPSSNTHIVPNGGGAFLAKYNPQGQLIWGYSYEGVGIGSLTPMELAVHSNGDIFVCGFISNDSVDLDLGPGVHRVAGNFQTGFIAKYNANGQFIWGFSLFNPNAVSGYSSSIVRDIDLDINGQLYAIGSFHNTIDFDPGTGVYALNAMDEHDMFVSKYTNSGQRIWTHQIGGGNGSEVGNTVHVDDSNRVYLGGSFYGLFDFDPGSGVTMSGYGNVRSGFFSQFDTSGQFNWIKAFKPSNDGQNNTTIDLITDVSGNVYATGNYYQNTDFDPFGANVMFSSSTVSAFLLKFSSSGQYIWGFPIEGSVYGTIPAELGITPALPLPPIVPGNIQVLIITGMMGGPADFAPGAGQFVLQAKGNQDAFIALYTTDSIPICAYSIGANSPNLQMGRGVSVLNNGNFVVTGEFGQGSADVDPIFGNQILQSQGFTDAFVVKYALDTQGYCAFGLPTGVEELPMNGVTIYPNPAQEHVTLKFDAHKSCKVVIYNAFGIQMQESVILNGDTIDMSYWASGIYYFIVQDEKTSYSCRLLKY